MPEDFADRVAGVAALAEPARRDLYLYVVAQPEAVSRDEAAAGVGVPRHTAKFHLDRLVDEGLLTTEFARRSGRRGPGAGRPAKLYRRAPGEVAVSLPERRYDLAGALLARAIETAADGSDVVDALHSVAADYGTQLAAELDTGPGGDEQPAGATTAAASVLARHGYEPAEQDGTLVLRNCPFHALAREHTELVCGMNLALMSALTEHSGAELTARLDPAEGRCCVVLAAG